MLVRADYIRPRPRARPRGHGRLLKLLRPAAAETYTARYLCRPEIGPGVGPAAWALRAPSSRGGLQVPTVAQVPARVVSARAHFDYDCSWSGLGAEKRPRGAAGVAWSWSPGRGTAVILSSASELAIVTALRTLIATFFSCYNIYLNYYLNCCHIRRMTVPCHIFI